DAWNERRRTIAQRYTAGLAELPGLDLPAVPAAVEHVFHLYVVRTRQRDALRAFLAERGIAAGVHYPRAVHEQGAYQHLGYGAGSCPNAEAAARKVLSLPIFPHLADAEVDRVVDAVHAFFEL
ncbi:MAG TPA: DegT/DnrJ/EryC1/StrS family aminotransferase, partial [Anaerolineae bacterium]|nr:DegT/DnrJ/EryC1/StrS family aminotransferase [Anaerolineae bacterium]